MSNIYGGINIDFDTDKVINKGQFLKFKKLLDEFVSNQLDMVIYEFANQCGFEADSNYPAIMGYLECEFEE